MLNEPAILQFSGGKDSTALMYLMRPWMDRITVYFADTGAVFPHVLDHVHRTVEKVGATLRVIRPAEDARAYTDRVGLPSDVVPIWATADYASLLRDKPKQLVQPTLTCCTAMLLRPMHDAIEASGIKVVLRGSKAADKRVGVPHGHVENGIRYDSPLWDWTDEEVFRYLAHEGVEMPAHYSKVNDSLDCWICTGHMATDYAADRMRWARENYPDLWPEIKDRMRRLRGALADADKATAAAFEECA